MSSTIKLKNINGNTLSVENNDLLTADKNVVYLDTVAQATSYVGSNGDVIHVSEADRGGVFVYDSIATDNQGTVFGKCVRQYDGAVNVKWFGADDTGTTECLQEVYNALASTSNKVDLAEGTYLIEADIATLPLDVSRLFNGTINSKNPDTATTRAYDTDSGEYIVSEFESILSGSGIDDLNYAAFTSCVNIGGLEMISNRLGKHHVRSATDKSGILLQSKNINEDTYTATTLLETAVGIDVRDPNMTQLVNTSAQNFLRWEEFDGTLYVTKLSLMSSASISSNFTISGIGTDIFTFGNTLITPNRKVLIAGYKTDGSVANLYISAEDYTSSTLTFSVATAFTPSDGGIYLEPVVSYADNKIVIIFRRETSWDADAGANTDGELQYSYDLEGGGSWTKVNLSKEIHGMFAEPYQEDSYSFFASNGEDRARITFFNTKDFADFSSYNLSYIGGNGGYPALLRGNQNTKLVFWENMWSQDGVALTTTRLRMQDVELDNLLENVPFQRKTYKEGSTVFDNGISYSGNLQVNNLYTSAGNGYKQPFVATDSFDVENLLLFTAGTSTATDSAVIEIYNDSDVLQGSSDALVLSNTDIKFHTYTFSTPVSLTRGTSYYFKINGLHKAYRYKNPVYFIELRSDKVVFTDMYTSTGTRVNGSYMPYAINNNI